MALNHPETSSLQRFNSIKYIYKLLIQRLNVEDTRNRNPVRYRKDIFTISLDCSYTLTAVRFLLSFEDKTELTQSIRRDDTTHRRNGSLRLLVRNQRFVHQVDDAVSLLPSYEDLSRGHRDPAVTRTALLPLRYDLEVGELRLFPVKEAEGLSAGPRGLT